MRFVAEPISNLRLQRFHRWAMLWLKWFAAFLDAAGAFAPISAQAEKLGHHWLDRVERVVLAIIMLRARPRVRCIQNKSFAVHRLKQDALRRAVIGAAMRRSLRPRQLRQRVDALMQDIDALAAHLLKRLPRGLTCRRPILARKEARFAHAPSACSAF